MPYPNPEKTNQKRLPNNKYELFKGYVLYCQQCLFNGVVPNCTPKNTNRVRFPTICILNQHACSVFNIFALVTNDSQNLYFK